MSIITDKVDANTGRYIKDSASVVKPDPKKDTLSGYTPDELSRDAIHSILKDFKLSWQTMHLPRPEFNDMSLYQRHIVDMLAFNTYQQNDGNPMLEDRLGGWRSQAMRPVQRNKAVSIAAHLTARATVPKVFAYNQENEEQEDSSQVMSYLLDWARDQADYNFMSVHRTIMALYSPISWGYSEYTQTYRKVKDTKGPDGKWKYKEELDEDESGFIHLPIPTDQVFFPNFFEKDCQKQDYLILRRVISYDRAKAKYGHLPNFQYVQPGIIVVMDDANNGYYNVYDPHMRQYEVEEVIRWKKWGDKDCDIDTRLVMVNGVLLSDPDNQNPRNDHQYPFDSFYYLPINERCIAGKSLVAALAPESALLNAQYQMINDGAYMNLFPPTVTTGSDKVGSDVMVPGLNLAFSEDNVEIKSLNPTSSESIMTLLKANEQVEASLNQSSQDPVQQGQNPGTPSTAYEISRIEQNAATVLGLTMKFKAHNAVAYGKLLLSDCLQYLTIADAEKITENDAILYKTFFTPEPGQPDKMNKIQFDSTLPDSMTDEEKMDMSFQILMQEGGIKAATKLWKVNPIKFREFKYKFTVDSDVINPRSKELERAMDLETYDRAIANPTADQEQIFKDLLMSTNPKTALDPDKYIKPQQPSQPASPLTGNTVSPENTNVQPVPSQMGTMTQ